MLDVLKGLFGPAGRVNLERRFSISCETPQGSMSRVYRAVDKESGRTVCLKIQLPEKQTAAESRAHRETRPPEGDIAMKVVHPNVVRTYEHGITTDGERFIVMEFILGVSLKFVREATKTGLRAKVGPAGPGGRLPGRRPRRRVHPPRRQSQQLPGRSRQQRQADRLRPGRAQHAVLPEARQPHGDAPVHGPRADPPRADRRADRHSSASAMMAYELLTLRLPFGGGTSTMAQMTQRINSEPPIDPVLVNPRISDDLRDILLKTLARRKEERWQKMSTLGDALREGQPPPRRQVRRAEAS